MQNNAAVFRTGEVLEEGCQKLEDLFREMKDVKVNDRSIKLCLSLHHLCRCLIKALCGTLT